MSGFFADILDFSEGTALLTVQSVLLCLLATFVLGQAIAWVYIWTHRGISYSSSMAQSLVVLSLIVALVMMVIGNNIARAFGLFGALALIRFRTPVKDAKDTVFLFLAVALGIATGTGNILVGVVATVAISLVFLYLARTRFGSRFSHDGLFRFRLPLGGEQEEKLREVLNRYCATFRLLHLRETGPGSIAEFSYQVKMIDPRYSSRLVAEVEGIEGVSDLSLLMQDTEATP